MVNSFYNLCEKIRLYSTSSLHVYIVVWVLSVAVLLFQFAPLVFVIPLFLLFLIIGEAISRTKEIKALTCEQGVLNTKLIALEKLLKDTSK